ncbi:P-loop NTPase fold protein [Anaerospora hongkongensis]|uniref:P-loop NTPase fold protein n=1 Tax=Anaerospora hongkongensis TaxID=244830 RepID=UPI00289EFDC7|nr:P-loop NTPase fold protein [Anaerospora hongkongensis]
MESTQELVKETLIDFIGVSFSDYALLITGSWGSGKTYFWKNTLESAVRERRLTPVYVSLNGIETADELYSRVTAMYLTSVGQAYGLKESKRKRLAAVLEKMKNLKSISLKSLFEEPLFEKVELPVGIIMQAIQSTLSYEGMVICFDDLERAKNGVKTAWPLISDIIENKKGKIVIIADETRIKPEENYNEIKEKVIGKTVTFSPDLKSVLESLLNNYQETYNDHDYCRFLTKYLNDLINVINHSGTVNLRVVRNFIKDFHKIYDYSRLKHVHCLEKAGGELVLFAFAVASEIGIGRLKKEYTQLFIQYNPMSRIFSTTNMKKESNYLDDFFCRYNKLETLGNFPSVVGYFLTGYFSNSDFDKEISAYDLKATSLSPAERIANTAFWEFSDEDFNNLTHEAMTQIAEGRLPIGLVPKVAYRLLSLISSGITFDTPHNITTAFLQGLKQIKNQKNYDGELDLIHEHFDDYQFCANSSEYKRIRENAKWVNRYLRSNAESNEVTKNSTSLIAIAQMILSEKPLSSVPIFSYLKPALVYKLIETAENKDIIILRNALENRNYFNSRLREEYKNLSNLKSLLMSNMLGDPGSIRRKCIQGLIKTVNMARLSSLRQRVMKVSKKLKKKQ